MRAEFLKYVAIIFMLNSSSFLGTLAETPMPTTEKTEQATPNINSFFYGTKIHPFPPYKYLPNHLDELNTDDERKLFSEGWFLYEWEDSQPEMAKEYIGVGGVLSGMMGGPDNFGLAPNSTLLSRISQNGSCGGSMGTVSSGRFFGGGGNRQGSRPPPPLWGHITEWQGDRNKRPPKKTGQPMYPLASYSDDFKYIETKNCPVTMPEPEETTEESSTTLNPEETTEEPSTTLDAIESTTEEQTPATDTTEEPSTTATDNLTEEPSTTLDAIESTTEEQTPATDTTEEPSTTATDNPTEQSPTTSEPENTADGPFTTPDDIDGNSRIQFSSTIF